MSTKEDVNEIVQSFVDNDLASLDRIGGESESFTLSPHLAQPSPDPAAKQTGKTFDGGAKPQLSAGAKGPELKPVAPADGLHNATASHSEAGTLSAGEPTQQKTSTANSATSQAASQPGSGASGVSSTGAGSGPTSTLASPDIAASQSTSSSRHVSTSSTASLSTLEREKRSSFGDRFKKFGKRITSGSKK